MREAYDAAVELMAEEGGEGVRHFIQRKDDEMAALEQKYHEQSSDHERLELYIHSSGPGELFAGEF